MEDDPAALRHDLNRYQSLLRLNSDKRICEAIRQLIAEAEARLREQERRRGHPLS
jgi:hypothetical protein